MSDTAKNNSRETIIHFIKAARSAYNERKLGAQGFVDGKLNSNEKPCMYEYPSNPEYHCAIGAGFAKNELKKIKQNDLNEAGSCRVFNDMFNMKVIGTELGDLQEQHDYWADAARDDASHIFTEFEKEFVKELERLESKYGIVSENP
jgi:hypothetical protein